MSLNLASLNQRYNYLLNLVNSIITGLTPVPTSSNLSDVLTNGNSAGTNDIDMNSQDISNVNQITLDVGGSVNNIITDSTLTITDLVTNNSNTLTTSNINIYDGFTGVQNTMASGGMNIFNTFGESLNLNLQGLTYNGIVVPTIISNDNGQDIEINAGGNLNLKCDNLVTLVRQGTSVLQSDTNLIEFQITENVDNSILRFTTELSESIIESNNELVLKTSNDNVRVEAPQGYITHQCGKMARTEEIRQTVGDYLEPNANFFTTNNQNVQLYRVDTYFNPLTPKRDGWYCYLFNYDNGINLTSDDGKTIIGKITGPSVGTYPIQKWSTQRISLVWVDAISDYVWSVSE